MSNQLEKVIEMVNDIKVAMLVTSDKDDYLRSRPMNTSKVETNGTIWFFTDNYSDKVSEIKEEALVNLAYADPNNQDFLSITGKASIVNNKAKMEELWSPIMKAWFPKGLESDSITLVKVKPESAEYWDSSSSKMVQLFHIASAIAKGTKYEDESNADHDTVTFN